MQTYSKTEETFYIYNRFLFSLNPPCWPTTMDKNGPKVSSKISSIPKCHSWVIVSNCHSLYIMDLPSSCSGLTCQYFLSITLWACRSSMKVPFYLFQVFTLALLPHLSEKTSIPLDIFRIMIIVINLLLIVLYIVHFRSSFMNNSLTKVLNLLIFISMIVIVPTTHLTIASLKKIN